jgi:hypothetical protein
MNLLYSRLEIENQIYKFDGFLSHLYQWKPSKIMSLV